MNVKKTLEKHGLKPSKYSDQHFLLDEKVLEREVESTKINENDTVLEIGAGIGNLTEKLVKKAKKVIAIEREEQFCKILLEKNFPNLTVIQGDVLRARFPKFNKIVSNLPYGISSPITFKILEYEWDLAVLTYQKEFAERFVAKPGDSNYSRLSVAVQYYSEPEILKIVPKSKFYPEPEVDSSVVRLRQKRVKTNKNQFFWNLVRACFRHKNKKVKNALLDSIYNLNTSEKEIKSLKEPILEKRVFKCSINDFKMLENLLKNR